MKQSLFILLLCLAYFPNANAQGLMVDALNHIGQAITDIETLDDEQVWAIGQNKIMYSADQGDQWTKIDFNDPEETLKFISPFSKDHFLVGGEKVFITEDQGNSWLEVPDIIDIRTKANFGQDVILVSRATGVHLSNNAGKDWVNITPTGFNFYSSPIAFVDGNNGFSADESGNLLATTDGGTNWTIKTNAPFPSPIEFIAFKDITSGFLKVSDSLLYTVDGGVNWELIDIQVYNTKALYASESGYFDLSGSRVRIVGLDGSWSYLTSDAINGIDNSLDFEESGNTQYITGTGMILRKEINQPQFDWVDLTPGPNSGFQQMAISGDQIFLTSRKKFQISTDYGNQFMEGTADGFSIDNKVWIDTNGDLYTCDLRLSVSTDQGNNWTYIDQAKGFHKREDGKLFYGNNQEVVSTTDMGTTTEIVFNIPDGRFSDIFFLNNSFGWIATSSSETSYRTTDGGITWEEIQHEYDSPTEIQFLDENFGFGFSKYDDVIFTTNDKGDTWEELYLSDQGITIDITSLVFMDQNHGFVCGEHNRNDNGVIYETLDGGQTWSLFQYGYAVFQDLVYDAEKETLWVVGLNGQLLKYSVCNSLQATLSLNDNNLTCNESSTSYKWFFEGDFLVETSEPTLKLIEVGNYSVRIIGEEECVSNPSEEIYFDGTTSINDLERTIDLAKIFPNPNDGSFTLDLTAFDQPVVTIYSLSGQQLTTEIENENNLYFLTNIPTGSYFIQILSKDKREVKKVVVY